MESLHIRPFGDVVHLYLNARFEKVQQAKNVHNATIIMTRGLEGRAEGHY